MAPHPARCPSPPARSRSRRRMKPRRLLAPEVSRGDRAEGALQGRSPLEGGARVARGGSAPASVKHDAVSRVARSNSHPQKYPSIDLRVVAQGVDTLTLTYRV